MSEPTKLSELPARLLHIGSSINALTAQDRADLAAAIAKMNADEAEIERLRVNIDALCGVFEVHGCISRPEMTVGECIKAGLCACSCEWLIVPERSAA